MKKTKKIIGFILLLLLIFITGCNSLSVYDDLKLSLTQTINELQENYDLNNVVEDLEFIEVDKKSYTYEWISSNQDVISNTGEVTRSVENVEVVITVKIYKDNIYYQDNFTCIVLKLESDGYTYDIKNTKSSLTIYELNKVNENDEYNNYLDVIAYIYYFHKLPTNYLTKSQAKSLGWSGSGNVWVNSSLQGKNIGGDTFKNYEQYLPVTDSNTYIEVDVNCSNGVRGQYRIVYNRYTFDIYYTKDHYNTFTYMIGVIK